MNKFLSFSEARRRTVCKQAQNKLGLPPATIEKDFWVCWTLKKLFTLPEWGSKLTFKGGTSLSKGWALTVSAITHYHKNGISPSHLLGKSPVAS